MSVVIDELRREVIEGINGAQDENALQQAKSRLLGKKSKIGQVLKSMKNASPDERREMGKAVNMLKKELEQVVLKRREAIREAVAMGPDVDLSLGGRHIAAGALHPLRLVQREIEDVFLGMGFSIKDGPHIETDWFNFTALNMPEDHPARDMQDTFYTTGERLLRTHTSGVQIHTMLEEAPPLRVICPGTVFRSDDVDQTHLPMFHQVEGLMVDDKVTFADLKGILTTFARRIFGAALDVRFRASYFPFTEPSAEMDIQCFKCLGHGNGCRVCKDTGWVEILGCGMVNPEVFRQVGKAEYLAEGIRGFAFGMGIDRIAMLKYGMNDLRLLIENDTRFLSQF